MQMNGPRTNAVLFQYLFDWPIRLASKGINLTSNFPYNYRHVLTLADGTVRHANKWPEQNAAATIS